jgi:hypothetical protein
VQAQQPLHARHSIQVLWCVLNLLRPMVCQLFEALRQLSVIGPLVDTGSRNSAVSNCTRLLSVCPAVHGLLVKGSAIHCKCEGGKATCCGWSRLVWLVLIVSRLSTACDNVSRWQTCKPFRSYIAPSNMSTVQCTLPLGQLLAAPAAQ